MFLMSNSQYLPASWYNVAISFIYWIGQISPLLGDPGPGLGDNIQYIHILLFWAYCCHFVHQRIDFAIWNFVLRLIVSTILTNVQILVILYTNELILPFETLCCLTLIVSTILMNVQILGDKVVKVTFVCVNKMDTRYIGAYRSTHLQYLSCQTVNISRHRDTTWLFPLFTGWVKFSRCLEIIYNVFTSCYSRRFVRSIQLSFCTAANWFCHLKLCVKINCVSYIDECTNTWW